MSDGRIIPEGRDLNGPGLSIAQVYRKMLKILKAHAEVIALHDKASKVNGIVFRGKIVRAKGFEARKWFGNRNTVFTIYTRKGKSQWYGASAEDALSNASPWLKYQPTKIEVTEIKGA